jgi:hypothetical protein
LGAAADTCVHDVTSLTRITRVTLVTGATASQREAAIAASLDAHPSIQYNDTETAATTSALILEGLPDGIDVFSRIGEPRHSSLHIARIAPGCVCCVGNLTMRVTLNRMLRNKPARLYIGLASTEHLDTIRKFLSEAPYDILLELTQDLHA